MYVAFMSNFLHSLSIGIRLPVFLITIYLVGAVQNLFKRDKEYVFYFFMKVDLLLRFSLGVIIMLSHLLEIISFLVSVGVFL